MFQLRLETQRTHLVTALPNASERVRKCIFHLQSMLLHVKQLVDPDEYLCRSCTTRIMLNQKFASISSTVPRKNLTKLHCGQTHWCFFERKSRMSGGFKSKYGNHVEKTMRNGLTCMSCRTAVESCCRVGVKRWSTTLKLVL